MACSAGVRGAPVFFAERLGKGLHFCSYITTSNRNYVLNHVSYHRLRCAVDGRVVAARGAELVLQPRRDLLAGGAAAAASSLLVPEAIAKKPLCLPGTNSAKALGGPGYTIGILVRGPCRIGRRLTHGSIHAGARHAELQGVA